MYFQTFKKWLDGVLAKLVQISMIVYRFFLCTAPVFAAQIHLHIDSSGSLKKIELFSLRLQYMSVTMWQS